MSSYALAFAITSIVFGFVAALLATIISIEEDIVERKNGTGKDVVNRAKDFQGDI